MHHFADASKLAYGAVSYLRITVSESRVRRVFLMGKGHLAQALTTTTIPRLELLAAVTAVRLDCILKKGLSITVSRIVFWSNSTAVLHSVYNSRKRFKVFIANRLAEIEKYSDITSWRYVPSKLNPADEVSRGASTESFVTSSAWLSGSDFFRKAEDMWPKPLERLPEDVSLLEKKVQPLDVMLAIETPSLIPTDVLIAHFSSLFQLKRAVVRWLRFFEFLRMRKRAQSKLSKESARWSWTWLSFDC